MTTSVCSRRVQSGNGWVRQAPPRPSRTAATLVCPSPTPQKGWGTPKGNCRSLVIRSHRASEFPRDDNGGNLEVEFEARKRKSRSLAPIPDQRRRGWARDDSAVEWRVRRSTCFRSRRPRDDNDVFSAGL